MSKITIEKAALEQALAALVRSEVMHGQPNFDIQKKLREALEQEPPPPPPECKTEAERTAYAFGWFKALETVQQKKEVK